MEAIVIFGGTFDPPHIKHFWILESLVNTHWINKVMIVPAKQNPDKKWIPLFEFDIRIKMLQETVRQFGEGNQNFNKLIFDTYFNNQPTSSYIVDYIKNNCASNIKDIWVYIPINYYEWTNSKDLISAADNFVSVVHKNDIFDSTRYLDITSSKSKRFLIIRPEFGVANISSTTIRKYISNRKADKIEQGILCSFVLTHCKNKFI